MPVDATIPGASDNRNDISPGLWETSPLLVHAAELTGSPYKCPACGVFALSDQGCDYCGWPEGPSW